MSNLLSWPRLAAVLVGGLLLASAAWITLLIVGGYVMEGLDSGRPLSLLGTAGLTFARVVFFPATQISVGGWAETLIFYLNAVGWVALAYMGWHLLTSLRS